MDSYNRADVKNEIEGKKTEPMRGISIPIEKSDENIIPIYYQLKKAIKEQIENGSLAVGMRIPPERKIAKLNNVSLATVRRALQDLVRDGLLVRIQGKGTYVASTAMRQKKIRYYSFVKDFQSDLSQIEIKLIDLKNVKGQQEINHHLKINITDDLYELRRIMILDGKPLVYCISYLPQNMFKGLDDYERSFFEEYALYLFLEEKFNVSTISNVQLSAVALADEVTAKLLNVNAGHPLLMLEMLTFTHKDRPYEYRISYCLTDERKLRRIIL